MNTIDQYANMRLNSTDKRMRFVLYAGAEEER